MILVIYMANQHTVRPQPSNFLPKKFLTFFLKKPCSEKVSYIFSKKSFSNFQETELFHIFFKQGFLLFWERYIQDLGIFRTRSIIRTLVYSEPETYSEHCQTFTMKRFAKVATLNLVHFLSPISKFLYFLKFREMELSSSNIKGTSTDI